jgi:hypothetical protein
MIKLRLRSAIRKSRDQRGVTLLETAIVLPMLLMLAIGLAEVGFLVIDQMAVANAAREGARVGAAAGPYEDSTGTIDADDLILRSVEQALCHLENGRAERVLIYPADADGGFANLGLINEYVLPPATPLNCTSTGTTAFVCISCPWDPPTRDNTPPILDDIGVEVEYKHDPILGFFPFTSILDLSDRAVMRIEPDTRG